MRTRLWWSFFVDAVGGAASLCARAQEAQVHMLDETELYVRLWTQDAERGYVLRVNTIVYGIGSQQDAIRLDLKQRGRVVATVRCPFRDFDDDVARLVCETDSESPLTITGDVSVDLVYLDDVAETSEVIRSMNLRINAYPYWVRDEGSRHVMGARYQIDGSDQLGTAFAWMENSELTQTETEESQAMYFYSSFSGSFRGGSAVLRCTAGGE